MEPRFGYDFSAVRVHTDSVAAASATAVNASAYTVGQHIVFGPQGFEPHSAASLRRLTHELTHVVQQHDTVSNIQPSLEIGGRYEPAEVEAHRVADGVMAGHHAGVITAFGGGILRRAETDTSGGCADLEDSKSDVNEVVNKALTAARASAGKDVNQIIRGLADLTENKSIGRTGIEGWAEKLGDKKARQPEKAKTKYADVSYGLWKQPFFPILNPTMRINNICVGSDKLGHFMQQGLQYFQLAHQPGKSAADAEKFGAGTEAGGFGLESTGVYSNADLEANRQGLRFYEDLAASPAMMFEIAKYINPRWNEEVNPSHYEASVGPVVWRNLLHGSWSGSFATDAEVAILVTNLAVAEDKVSLSGQFGYKTAGGTVVTGTLTNGRITHTKNALNAITGVTLDFDWQSDKGKGKGNLTSINENTLEGRLESEAAGAGGSCKLTRSRVALSVPAKKTTDACLQDCEEAFNRCTRLSSSGGMVCIAQRSGCINSCSAGKR